MSEPESSEVWQDTWVRLVRATRDRQYAFRRPVVATHCPRLGVRTRTVVLRHAEPKYARLRLYTDCRSGKLEALEIEPSLSRCFHDGRQRVQVSAESRVTVHVGDAVAREAAGYRGGQALCRRAGPRHAPRRLRVANVS